MTWGYIKLHRPLRQHWLWEEKPFSPAQAWIDLLLRANHTDKTFTMNNRAVTVRRGQLLTGTERLAADWGWTRKKVRTFLDRLEADGMIRRLPQTRYSFIEFLNYPKWQDSTFLKDPAPHSSGPEKGPQKRPDPPHLPASPPPSESPLLTPLQQHPLSASPFPEPASGPVPGPQKGHKQEVQEIQINQPKNQQQQTLNNHPEQPLSHHSPLSPSRTPTPTRETDSSFPQRRNAHETPVRNPPKRPEHPDPFAGLSIRLDDLDL